ncbi:MAG: hypothetical protein JW730_12340 [Anaerolineales bacterium]|nr:hypothetical protein [Anaerolineales bacterium]
MSISKEISTLISEALAIIEANVQIDRDLLVVTSSGSEGQVMEAIRKLQAAHDLCPEEAAIHYALAGGLHLAAQFESAESEMKACLQMHPDFPLAQLALQNWRGWRSPFTLPKWGADSESVPQAVSRSVLVSTLLSVRDGLVPRAAIFLRDSAGDFQDLQALNAAKIALATVISPVNTPQLIGVYAKIYDNPASPYEVECLESPFRARGHPTRATFEIFCLQKEVDFVVIDGQDHILLNKRLPISTRMQEMNSQVFKMLGASEGRDISPQELMQAVMNHQAQFTVSAVRY